MKSDHSDAVAGLEPPREPKESAFDDFIQLLTQAMTHAQAAGEALIVAIGGWAPPPGPYCLFMETGQQGVRMNSFQTAPPPEGSEWLWSSGAATVEGPRVTLRLPAGPETLERGPWLMMDAIYRWGLAPWDLVLTFVPGGSLGFSRRRPRVELVDLADLPGA